MTGIRITITPGELLDRITILEVRIAHSDGKAPAAEREYRQLCKIAQRTGLMARLSDCYPSSWDEMRAINRTIWDAEDIIRLCMKAEQFNSLFVKAAREAHEKNDERARLKAEINRLLGAPVEEKSYGEGPKEA